jgi:hypothetical protein
LQEDGQGVDYEENRLVIFRDFVKFDFRAKLGGHAVDEQVGLLSSHVRWASRRRIALASTDFSLCAAQLWRRGATFV